MWREIEGFKECEKIEFDFSTGKTYEESINKLHKIIAAYGTTRAILDFLRMVANEDCAFYRYKYIFPEQSPTKEEMRALHVLWRWGKVRTDETAELYWLAYKFFAERGYVLTHPDNRSPYLSVKKGSTLADMLQPDGSIGNTTVRCGEIDANRIGCGIKAIWVLPPIDTYSSDEEYSIYILEIKPEYKLPLPEPFDIFSAIRRKNS